MSHAKRCDVCGTCHESDRVLSLEINVPSRPADKDGNPVWRSWDIDVCMDCTDSTELIQVVLAACGGINNGDLDTLRKGWSEGKS
ncbi:MAG: hypothetical protein ACPGVG_05395 [Mycobacterium sp.]